MSRYAVLTLSAVLALSLGAALGASWCLRQLHAPLNIPADGMFLQVERGAALSTVTSKLEDRNVVRHAWIIDWYARLSGTSRGIRAGEYRLEPGLTGLSLLASLGRGDVYLHQFTIIEGWRFSELLSRLRAHPAILAGNEDGAAIMAALGEPGVHPEGQFLPDTYYFPRGTSDLAMLRRAHDELATLLDQAWRERSDDGVLNDRYDGLILASIIEKETALDEERSLISGVLHTRLRRGMRLQTDPTVIYGLGEAFDGNLTRADLNTDTPYNTYTRSGLPPTPISLPGRASILAAFVPVESGALYFVATGDPDGSHAFSSTLEEHNAAVERYLQRQRSAP